MRKETSKEIFYAALKAVDPYEAVRLYGEKIRTQYENGQYKHLFVIGFGKASCSMAKALEEDLDDLIDAGYVITKYGHCPKDYRPIKISICEAGHPIPDENGLRGASEIINILKDADASTLVVCLISGGGSALLAAPWEGISLQEKQRITDLLLRAGADITELNTVRKHISKVKGGRLAEVAAPAKVISLLVSDVIGDKLDVIASGPTFYDPSTYKDALTVLEKYSLADIVPHSAIELIKKGMQGTVPETPKEGSRIFENVDNIIIGSLGKAIRAAKERAEALGYETIVLSETVQGEARDAAAMLANKAMEMQASRKTERPLCLISGGETTVTVKGTGKGGRNMELALVFSEKIKGLGGITLLSAGTDGTDGPTDAAGALVDGQTILNAKTKGIDPAKYLLDNDSYNFFKQAGGLFITGPTGTNVMDIQIALIDPQK